MNDYQTTGSILQIYPAKSFPSGFVVREFVVTTEDEYPQSLVFEVIKEKCALLDSLVVGERVNVKFRIRGSATKDGQRFFNKLSVWQIDRLETGPATAAPGDDEPPMMQPPPGMDDEMPF